MEVGFVMEEKRRLIETKYRGVPTEESVAKGEQPPHKIFKFSIQKVTSYLYGGPSSRYLLTVGM